MSVSLNTVAADVLSQIVDSLNDSDSDSSDQLDPTQALSQILSSLNASGGDTCDGLDPSQDDTTSDIDPASQNAQPFSLQDLGLNQFNPLSALLGSDDSINPQPLPPRGGEFNQRLSPRDDWGGTPPHVPPP